MVVESRNLIKCLDHNKSERQKPPSVSTKVRMILFENALVVDISAVLRRLVERYLMD